MPILTPCLVVKIVGRWDSALVRAVPTCAILARSRSSSVRFRPAKPWSTLWLEAVVHTS